MSEAQVKVITVSNAGSCTAYELRQELNRRNAFDLDENKVTFKALLQRLMVELVKDENKADAERADSVVSAANEQRDAAKADRERKKAEAIERSKQRQANPEYFAQRGTANADLKARQQAEASADAVEVVGGGGGEEEEPEKETGGSDDPFRTYVSKSKNKIFVK